MTVTCPCGGRFRRTDLVMVFSKKRRRFYMQDTDPKAAHWQCNKCKTVRVQRKRQSEQVVQ